MVVLPWATWERLLLWLALGLVVYFAYGARRAARVREARAAARLPGAA
jgi:APA family basic amino acid/polyamine antiporter